MRNEYLATIIIPTYNNENELRLTINSIINSNIDLNNIEILICDDGSINGMLTIVKEFEQHYNVRYFYQKDLDFRAASARNMGILNAKSNICIFIDSGVVIDPDCIINHIKSHSEKHVATIGYVYGFDNLNIYEKELRTLVDVTNVRKSIKVLEDNNITDMRNVVYKELGDNLEKWPAPWCYFWGLNISIDKQDLVNVGMFDESYTEWGGEDVDLGLALYTNNVKIKLCKSATAIHLPHKKNHNMAKDFEEFKKNLIKVRLKLYEKYKLPELLIWTKVLDSTKFNSYLLAHEDEWRKKR